MSLRKKKTHELINAKRRRMFGGPADPAEEHVQVSYHGYPRFDSSQEEYQKLILGLCPQFVQDKSLTLVRESKLQCDLSLL